MIDIKYKNDTSKRKGVWINQDVHKEIRKISRNPRNRVTMYSLVNDLILYGLKNLNYDKETGEIKEV